MQLGKEALPIVLRTCLFFWLKTLVVSVMTVNFDTIRALLRNCKSSYRVRGFRCVRETIGVVSPMAPLPKNSPAKSGRSSAASRNPESTSAFCTSSCNSFLRRFHCCSYAVISPSGSRLWASGSPPWRLCLDPEFILPCTETLAKPSAYWLHNQRIYEISGRFFIYVDFLS